MNVRPDRQFSIGYSSYKGYRAVPSLESYTSSPLELRLELQLDIGSNHGYLDYERHHRITIHKDCLTGRNSIITGLIYRKTVSRSDTPGQ